MFEDKVKKGLLNNATCKAPIPLLSFLTQVPCEYAHDRTNQS